MEIKIKSLKDLQDFLSELPGDLARIRYFNRINQCGYDVVFDPPLKEDSRNTLRFSLEVSTPDCESHVPYVRWDAGAVHFGLRPSHPHDGSVEIVRFDEGTLTLIGELLVGKRIQC